MEEELPKKKRDRSKSTFDQKAAVRKSMAKKRPVSKKILPLDKSALTAVNGATALIKLFPNDILPINHVFPSDYNPLVRFTAVYPSKCPPYQRSHINWNSLIEMCKIQCTMPEIEAITGVCNEELDRRCRVIFDMSYADFRAIHQSDGKMSLRRKMVEKAMAGEGDTQMLKHLSAHYLGMTAKSEEESSVTTNITISFADLKKMGKEIIT